MNNVNYQYIDLTSIKEDTYGDVSILKEIMGFFIEIIDEYIAVLNEEIPKKNWESLFKATHKIKPNISMFGISKLESIILELENNFRNETNLETVDELANYVLKILVEVKSEIELELESMPNE